MNWSKNRMTVIKLLLTLLLTLIIGLFFYKNTEIDNFYIIQKIDYYVITMKEESRMKNIKTQIENQKQRMKNKDEETKKNDYFDFTINEVDAVIGKNLDLKELIVKNIVPKNVENIKETDLTHHSINNRKNEIGCYMSHLKTYDAIANSSNKTAGYSVVFEDDFILSEDFVYKLESTLKTIIETNIDFDILVLGIAGGNGETVNADISYANLNSFGGYGYLINNKKIDKIINEMKYIDTVVDVKIFKNGHEKKLIVMRMKDPIVLHGNYGSTIR